VVRGLPRRITSVVSRIRFDNGMLQGPPHPRAPRSPRPPRGGWILLPSPLWGRGWRASGVIASRGGPGEGVSPIVNSYVGHHTSSAAARPAQDVFPVSFPTHLSKWAAHSLGAVQTLGQCQRNECLLVKLPDTLSIQNCHPRVHYGRGIARYSGEIHRDGRLAQTCFSRSAALRAQAPRTDKTGPRYNCFSSATFCSLLLFMGSVLICDVAPGFSPACAALKGGATFKIGHYLFLICLDIRSIV
jgi:hypothetical protein